MKKLKGAAFVKIIKKIVDEEVYKNDKLHMVISGGTLARLFNDGLNFHSKMHVAYQEEEGIIEITISSKEQVLEVMSDMYDKIILEKQQGEQK